MSWTLLLLFGAGSYALKALGLVIIGRRGLPVRVRAVAGLLPAAMLAGLVALQTLGGADGLVVDERLLGVAAGAVLVWRKAPFLVVVIIAAAVTAAARAWW